MSDSSIFLIFLFINYCIIQRCRPVIRIIDSIATQINIIIQSKHNDERTHNVFFEEKFEYWTSFANVMNIPNSLLLYVTLFIKPCVKMYFLFRREIAFALAAPPSCRHYCMSAAFHSALWGLQRLWIVRKLAVYASSVCSVIWRSISVCNLQFAKWHVTNSTEHNNNRKATCCLANE